MSYSKRCIVTGAASFIGSALTRLLLKKTEATVLVIDKLAYAGVPENLKGVGLNPTFHVRKQNPCSCWDFACGSSPRGFSERYLP